jgi:hypothetical protein
MTIRVKTVLAMILALMLIGCASHRTRVHCEGHLTAINAPAPATPSSARP